jgi:hypothetical protein
MLRDARIVDLDDAALRLWIATLCEAYHQTPRGVYQSDRVWRACVAGMADPAHLEVLVTAGLLSVTEIGEIVVVAWDRHQVDPTAAARSRRYRDSHATAPTRERHSDSHALVTPEIRVKKNRTNLTVESVDKQRRPSLRRPLTIAEIVGGGQ